MFLFISCLSAVNVSISYNKCTNLWQLYYCKLYTSYLQNIPLSCLTFVSDLVFVIWIFWLQISLLFVNYVLFFHRIWVIELWILLTYSTYCLFFLSNLIIFVRIYLFIFGAKQIYLLLICSSSFMFYFLFKMLPLSFAFLCVDYLAVTWGKCM